MREGLVSVWCGGTGLELVAELEISLVFVIIYDEEEEWNWNVFAKNGNEGIQSRL